MRALAILVALIVGLAGLLWSTFLPAPLPAPPPLAERVLPPASPPAAMAVFALPTGIVHRTAAFGYRGGGL